METVWHLLSPVGLHKQQAAAGRAAVAGKERVVGFLSNRKPNASRLLTDLMTRLKREGYETRFYEKLNAATPAADEVLERVVRECTSVIVASGD